MDEMSSNPLYGQVFVGYIGYNVTEQNLEDAFVPYGPVKSVWIPKVPPGLAFVTFDDARDAEDAVKGLDGGIICGNRVRVIVCCRSELRDRGSSRRGVARLFHPEGKSFFTWILVICSALKTLINSFRTNKIWSWVSYWSELISVKRARIHNTQDYDG